MAHPLLKKSEHKREEPKLGEPRLVQSESAPDNPIAQALAGESVSDTLIRARQQLGQDLRSIAEVLCIRYSYLDAIERGQYENLPGPTYAVGFMRTYADYLGLDGDEIVERFKSEVEGLDSQTKLHFPTPAPEGKMPGGAVFLVAALLFAGAYGVWFYLSNQGETLGDLVAPVPEQLQQMVDGATPPAAPAQPAPAAQDPAAPQAGSPVAQTPATSEPAPAETAPPAQTATTPSATPLSGESAPVAATPPAAGQAQPETPPAARSAAGRSSATPAPVGAAPVAPAPVTPDQMAPDPAAPDPAAPAPAASADRAQQGAVTQPQASAEADQQAAVSVPESVPAPAVEAPAEEADAAPTQANLPFAIPAAPDSATSATAFLMNHQPTVYGEENADARIVLKATQDAWVQVRDREGNLLLTRVLRVGDSYKVPNQADLTLLTGNAGGLEITVDGGRLPALGPVGAVRRNIPLDPEALRSGAGRQP